MTRPRADIAPPGTAGAFHCVQRCVRRAFLCGVDHYTGQCFDHRKTWIEDRIRVIAECFAVAIEAYAVMSNHLHLVLRIDPSAASEWSDEDIAARWVRLFPPRENSDEASAHKCLRILAQPERVSLLRQRLGSLSWLMRCLVEPIARRANREDGCKGRFWEGRYKCQRLCDERSLLAAMVYVDLNPIRAGMAEDLHSAVHTSAAVRMAEMKRDPSRASAPLKPVSGNLAPATSLAVIDYLQILDWTGRQLAPGKRGRIAETAPTPLARIDHDSRRWMTRVAAFGSGWYRVVGTAQDLKASAERMGLAWLKGIRLATRLA